MTSERGVIVLLRFPLFSFCRQECSAYGMSFSLCLREILALTAADGYSCFMRRVRFRLAVVL